MPNSFSPCRVFAESDAQAGRCTGRFLTQWWRCQIQSLGSSFPWTRRTGTLCWHLKQTGVFLNKPRSCWPLTHGIGTWTCWKNHNSVLEDRKRVSLTNILLKNASGYRQTDSLYRRDEVMPPQLVKNVDVFMVRCNLSMLCKQCWEVWQVLWITKNSSLVYGVSFPVSRLLAPGGHRHKLPSPREVSVTIVSNLLRGILQGQKWITHFLGS